MVFYFCQLHTQMPEYECRLIKSGQTVLTQKGEEIVAFFDKFYEKIKPSIDMKISEMQSELDRILR